MKKNRLLDIVARIVSAILHPVFIPLAFVLFSFPLEKPFITLHVIVFICLIAIPGGVTFLWLQIREEQDLFVVERANRIVPLVALLVGTVFFAMCNAILLPEELFQKEIVLNLLLLSFFAGIVTMYYKISLHMIGWGALLGAIAWNGFFLVNPAIAIALCVLTIVVAWARIQLKSHDWGQLLTGLGMGFGVAMLLWATAF